MIPRRQPFQVPYCSLWASTPQLASVVTAQSAALSYPGVPVSRGPMESSSVCAISMTRDSFMPISQIRRRTGSSTAQVWA
ncbi:MAG: hypothetical protein ACRDG7_06245, partial [Candidatus Limnocylindria bacterium]